MIVNLIWSVQIFPHEAWVDSFSQPFPHLAKSLNGWPRGARGLATIANYNMIPSLSFPLIVYGKYRMCLRIIQQMQWSLNSSKELWHSILWLAMTLPQA